ncbi:hypothetical protein [Oscillatoria sp. HE19RPO]|nr:hypothetical protein [Oscillatoria sp. HE19RPO]
MNIPNPSGDRISTSPSDSASNHDRIIAIAPPFCSTIPIHP